MARIYWMALCGFALLLAAACASNRIAKLEDLPPGDVPKLAAAEAIVFGRVQIIENGVKLLSYPAPFLPNLPFAVGVNESGSETYVTKRLEEDGTFYWVVPRVRREIQFIQYGTTGFINPKVAFHATGDVCYLGTLVADIEAEPVMLNRVNVTKVKNVTVEDNFADDSNRFSARFPDNPGSAGKCLMFVDPSIPLPSPLNADLAFLLPLAAAILFY